MASAPLGGQRPVSRSEFEAEAEAEAEAEPEPDEASRQLVEPDEASRQLVEAAILATDARVAVVQRRLRRADIAARAGRRAAVTDNLFHEPQEVFDAATEAVVALVGPQARPPRWLNLTASPRLVYRYFIEHIIAFGDEMRVEGAAIRADASAPRITPDQAGEAMRLMQQLNTLLAPRPTDT
jgi:hypothetical protein